jgi:signal transduction histidine kinase
MDLPAVFLVTPNATDASAGVTFLREANIEAKSCSGLVELCSVPTASIGCAVVVEEALVHPEIDDFLRVLAAQPAWSDLPLILIASQGAALGALIERVFPESGNVAVLERPLNPVSLISAVHVGLRARHRQFQVRDLLEQRANAVRLRDEFVAMLGHELRNPLAPMRNAVYIMKRMQNDDPTFVSTRALIDRQVTHMARLVDDLLDVSRLELGKVRLQLQELDLNVAVTAAAEACRAIVSARKHELDVRLAPAPVRADPVRIEQVIGNLITNAAKFTPEGGRVTVEARADEDTATVVVRDTGVGIRPDMLPVVFDLFRQDASSLARAEGGLGIGLTVVKRLVELHGGTIRVSSAGLGRGSEFSVRFPKSVAACVKQPTAAAPEARGGGRRVLVIEDNPDIRESLRLLLGMWGHRVDFAENGPDGLQRACTGEPEVALIDIGLPGLSGYDVAREIRSRKGKWSKAVKLIALTGYGRESDRDLALEAGFDTHLVKPIDPDILERTVSVA